MIDVPTETTLPQGYAWAVCAICNLPGIYATHDGGRGGGGGEGPRRAKQAPKTCGRLRCMTQTGEMKAV